MKPAETGKLLGGHATGTLTGPERRALYEAALADQRLFDALMDEEALRELLADPEARAQLLAALAPSSGLGPPKVVPFWRRPGVIGAAAGILMAATAGLAVLRSPGDMVPPAPKAEAAKVPALAPPAPETKAAPPARAKAQPEAVPRGALAGVAAGNPAPAAPAPWAAGSPGTAAQAEASQRVEAEARQAVARDESSRKAKAAVMEAIAPPAPAPRVAAKAAAPRSTAITPAPIPPAWTLEPLPDGSILVTVAAAPEATVVLLRRGAAGVEALEPGIRSGSEPWQFRLRLGAGEALDLYVLNAGVADPARLPETGPVDGFRARIHPAAEKDSLP